MLWRSPGRSFTPLASPRWRRTRALVLIGTLVALTLFLVATAAAALTRNQSPYAALGQLGRVLVMIENHYVNPVERHRLLQGAIKGMVAELDPHSAYLAPEDFQAFREETEGRFVGIGVEVDARTDVITVIAPIEGSPAARAGIRSGDRIIGVDGWLTRGQPLERVVRKIRGAAGTKVKVRVERNGEQLEFLVTREKIKLDSVSGRRLANDIAYLRIKQFQETTHAEFLQAIAAIRSQRDTPIRGALIDLRTNPGGLVDQASAVADEILDSGTIFTTRSRGRVTGEVKARSGGALASIPVVVLVNEYSASAAELLAGAIQDPARGYVVGAPTFGKGSVQSIMELPEGAGLKLTTALYFTPNGRSIQAEGIRPDVLVASSVGSGAEVPILRERDIEGHLPSPNGPGAGTASPAERLDAARAPASGSFRIGDNIPDNPANGSDTVLSIGYQLLNGVLSSGLKPGQPSRQR